MDKAAKVFGKLLRGGFVELVSTNVANKFISALTSILITCFLGKYSYGVLGTALNAYSIFTIFSGFGMAAAIMVFCSEKRSEDEKGSYYRYGFFAGIAANLFLAVCVLGYAVFGRLAIEETRIYIIILSALLPLDYIVQYFLIILRIRKSFKRYALMQNISSVTYFLFGCCGAYLGGIIGAVIGRYISRIVMSVLGMREIYPLVRDGSGLSHSKKRILWEYSIKNGFSAAFNQIYYLMDIAFIAYLLTSPELVASYKVAVMIPEAMSFIPSAIMVYFLPSIIEHNDNGGWLKTNVFRLMFYSGIFHAVLSILLVVFAPVIISLLWGSEYADSVECFRMMSVSYFFLATFRKPCTNILAGLKKINFNLFISVAAAAFNIAMDYVLIRKYSSFGAACATFLTIVFISCISLPYMIYSIRRTKNGQMLHS